jgi:DNA-binding MarR family transcriptional regulator
LLPPLLKETLKMDNDQAARRAERIIGLLPKIMGSIALWHHGRPTPVMSTNGTMRGELGDAKLTGDGSAKITINQYQALIAIRELGECSVNELAGKLRLAQSTTSQLVDRLVKAGMVTRETYPDDRRRMVVKLAKSGTDMMERRRQALLQTYERILSVLDEEEQAMLEDAFEKFYLVSARLEQKVIQGGVPV